MKKATLFTRDPYLGNKLFDTSDTVLNRDNCLYAFRLLRDRFAEEGIDLGTQDVNVPKESQFVLYYDMPLVTQIVDSPQKYLLISECEVIRPDNWNLSYHRLFRKIFTWHDKYIDGRKYIKVNFPQYVPSAMDFSKHTREKLCGMVVAHKHSRHRLSLYEEREKALAWFDRHHPDEFDLYGYGWSECLFTRPFSRLNQSGLLRRLFRHRYRVYKGTAETKQRVLEKHLFAICYENARGIPGYITEKIFDCFSAGCVPIYLGAPNVQDHIPTDTFIDKRYFKTYEELYRHIKSIPQEQYTCYLESIRDFLLSNRMHPFRAEYFVKTLVDTILRDGVESGSYP